MSDNFDEILASLEAGKNPTLSPDEENTVLSMLSAAKRTSTTDFGLQTVMEYVPNEKVKKQSDTNLKDLDPASDEK